MDHSINPVENIFPGWIQSQLPSCLSSYRFDGHLGRSHFLMGGQGAPVLFVHGNPTWSFLWRKVIGQLDPKKRQFIAPDLHNLGFSSALSDEDFRLENFSQSIVELVNKLDLHGICVVVQDWGGPIGLYAASQFAERVQSLVILNTGVSAPEPPYKISKFHSFVHKRFWPEILFKWGGVPMYSLHKLQGDPNSIKAQVAKAYRYPIRKTGRWDSALKFARMVPAQADDPAIPLMNEVESFCRNFSGPIEVVWGMKDPILGRSLNRIKRVLPKAHYTETQAGHFLQEEVPQEIAGAITRCQHIPV